MKQLINNLKGDRVIWSFVALLALFSFMPVFSASSNLAYLGRGTGNTLGYLVKHLAHICIGFLIIYWVHKVPYHYFRAISKVGLPVVWVLLAYTLIKGTVIAGANASRWIQVPFIGVTFQTSTLASIVLFIFVARYLSKTREVPITFKSSIWELWTPVFITLMFILPANFSTTALIFSMVLMLVFIGKYPIKYIAVILGSGIVFLAFFILLSKAFPDSKFFSRVGTWGNRIESFTTDKPEEDDYQIEKAKIAIASGKIYGLGPGKSIQKNFLPQSSSDFIFAIIVEEYGLIGGLGVLTLYLLLLFRFVIASHKATTLFGKLVVIGLGFPMIFQAMVNMAVAVELLPVTGQTLPLISSGGSSIWMTCFALGIIISVTKKEEEIVQELKEAAKREEALQKLIDRELEEETVVEESYSIEDKAKNPLQAVLNK
ncbi:cell division protein FtsW [Flavobacterium sp. GSP27]|uniref:Probable peptidoglycan glycosyltransferase FtsW n=1 Tax=Flavobacterium bomense TaxID=2497483 RepID=A0A3S0MGG7_9FLAO|nr:MULTISPECIES: FtsW/RodA/SpoVE family cell cycle protein [Flavobacterium]RTY93811.1 cell division protein FtsW [Flavobacterium sp. GSN2]RTY68809.1 cell division protein FtsW [Flavobacterium sp. LB2P53]RTY73688.1 cell division protein FtsW [Flavobacterium sp. LS1R10]RTY79564.1 cell division protein FtsW [Flavobacterium sp. LS1P28]RTY83996.1 cell division protein FtsW [Flavobacterium sp. ZB4P23]